MTDIDQRVREAYDEVHLPNDVRSRTLAAIEATRMAALASASFGAPQRSGMAQAPASGPTAPTVAAAATRRRPRRLLAIAACLLLVMAAIGGFGAFRAYATPEAYVDISVNPSIQLAVNSFGTVISAEGLNQDGEEVLASVRLAHCSYEQAMDALMASDAFLSYIKEDSLIDVSIASDNEQLGATLAAQTDATLANAPCQHQCHRADGTTCNNMGQAHGSGAGQGHGSGAGAGHGHQHHGSRAS